MNRKFSSRQIRETLAKYPALSEDPVALRLLPVVSLPTGMSSAGFAYLDRRAFEIFRDTIAHLFSMGTRVLTACETLKSAAAEHEDLLGVEGAENVRRACEVVRRAVQTAAITAPPDLWLMRHILGVHQELGLGARLLAGEAIDPQDCRVRVDGEEVLLDAEQLAIDLDFLLARGIVEQYDETFRIAGHPRVAALLEQLNPIPGSHPIPAAMVWAKLFDAQKTLTPEEARALETLGASAPPRRVEVAQNHWIPTLDEVQLGYLLVPVVLGLRAARRTKELREGVALRPGDLSADNKEGARAALNILESAGWVTRVDDARWSVNALGARGFARGPGPFGIIQTYHPYMAQAREILLHGRSNVWVRRGENVGASQDANRKTFRLANDALDRFAADTGFAYDVFIEHAIGRGEATRQRFERSGEDTIRYFGADLEDAAIDAAVLEQQAGRLPKNMEFVRQADIGKPGRLLDALRAAGVSTQGAVMLVGNGFHEARDQTDASMVEIFKEYQDAGIVLLFTEENALSIDDLRATAWNTYHAGFKYVHEKSGQCLRPASPRPTPRLGAPLRAAWSECATRAGYVRMDAYATRTRTIYPYARPGRPNPSISVNHFFVPRALFETLGSGLT
ncbi:hypothetical protein DFR33_108114 [Bradymonas sediminis]|nr:hypothetical protein DFR33_108114 [Bradymonas sediminis]